jgi:hypothetical protein
MKTMLPNTTTVTDGPSVFVESRYRNGSRPVDIQLTGGTATVVIEGRSRPDLGWIQLHSTTAAQSTTVSCRAEMRARVTAISGATVSVVLDAN